MNVGSQYTTIYTIYMGVTEFIINCHIFIVFEALLCTLPCVKAHIRPTYISYNQRHIECVTYIVHEVDIVLPSNYT